MSTLPDEENMDVHDFIKATLAVNDCDLSAIQVLIADYSKKSMKETRWSGKNSCSGVSTIYICL